MLLIRLAELFLDVPGPIESNDATLHKLFQFLYFVWTMA